MIVLCYHAANINGNAYCDNDHVALAQDLALLNRLGIAIAPASLAIDVAIGIAKLDAPTVALTFDDGIALDAQDFEHPNFGPQPSFARLLREHRQRTGQHVQAASFVIASSEARQELDRKAFLGLNIWHDDWWKPVSDEGLITIESHSFDHNHPVLDKTHAPVGSQGSFAAIVDQQYAEVQVVLANRAIEARTGRAPVLFAFPWGQTSDWLRDVFLPTRGSAIGLRGAFSTQPSPIEPGANPWWLPRYVCGEHWSSPQGLESILRDAFAGLSTS